MSRLFILGAGFSKPAGLPLGSELFADVWRLAKIRHYDSGKLQVDLDRYLRFVERTTGRQPELKEVNLEDFISFLDVEHTLHLKGNDHWSDEGNESQLLLRNLIALSLKIAQDHGKRKDLKLYDDFVKRLQKYDFVATFNYDTLLEEALERNSVPYKLVPIRYEEVNEFGGTVSNDPKYENEIEILKLHGSIDWFDISQYEKYKIKTDPVFGEERNHKYSTLFIEPYPTDSALYKLRRLHSMWEYLGNNNFMWAAPVIVAPSSHKLAYIHRFSELWRELTNAGLFVSTVGIIGFSLTQHDSYLKQVVYDIIDKFQNLKGERSAPKTKLKMIDFRTTSRQIFDYKTTYSFVNWEDTDCYFDGFNEESLDGLFAP